MLRFSHCAVPVGKVPSGGMALTGSSRRGPDHQAEHVADEGGSVGGTGDDVERCRDLGGGNSTSCRWARAASTAAKFF
jgi:hypothetical protein